MRHRFLWPRAATRSLAFFPHPPRAVSTPTADRKAPRLGDNASPPSPPSLLPQRAAQWRKAVVEGLARWAASEAASKQPILGVRDHHRTVLFHAGGCVGPVANPGGARCEALRPFESPRAGRGGGASAPSSLCACACLLPHVHLCVVMRVRCMCALSSTQVRQVLPSTLSGWLVKEACG